jgi:isochorismate synthase
MSYLFEKIKVQLKSQLPFVCYCKPNSDTIIALLQKSDALFELTMDAVGFAFVSFDNKRRYIIPESQSDLYYEKVSVSDYAYPKNRVFESDERAKTAFEALVVKAVQEIEAGTFEKVVLSRKEMVALQDFDLTFVLNQLITSYPNAFKYSFYHPKIGFWLGASPEQFLKVTENNLQTIALAGTQLASSSQDILWGDKEIVEQQIVADFIVAALEKHAVSVSKSEPYTYKAGSILHIRTDIEAVLEDKSNLENIIELMHPTPAVCGFPKEEAKNFILKNEGYDREFYAGFLGEWKKDFMSFMEDNFDLFVNLRCMKIKDGKAIVYVGCGINQGSQPEKEFVETVNKSQTMKKVL